jgi:CPA2 family monovalent cation:H+ antiporter-2
VSPARRPRPVAPADPLSALPLSTEEKYLNKQVVVVGYGRVGRHVCEALGARGVPYVVADENREIIEKLRAGGIPAVLGDASTAIVLAQAHVQRAAILVIATPNTLKARQMAETARAINPAIDVLIRSHSEVEAALLGRENVGELFIGERELARNISARVLEKLDQA